MIKNRPALESQFPHSEHALDMLEAGLNAAMPENFMLPYLEKFSRKKIHIVVILARQLILALTASKHITDFGMVDSRCSKRIFCSASSKLVQSIPEDISCICSFPAHQQLSAHLHDIS